MLHLRRRTETASVESCKANAYNRSYGETLTLETTWVIRDKKKQFCSNVPNIDLLPKQKCLQLLNSNIKQNKSSFLTFNLENSTFYIGFVQICELLC